MIFYSFDHGLDPNGLNTQNRPWCGYMDLYTENEVHIISMVVEKL